VVRAIAEYLPFYGAVMEAVQVAWRRPEPAGVWRLRLQSRWRADYMGLLRSGGIRSVHWRQRVIACVSTGRNFAKATPVTTRHLSVAQLNWWHEVTMVDGGNLVARFSADTDSLEARSHVELWNLDSGSMIRSPHVVGRGHIALAERVCAVRSVFANTIQVLDCADLSLRRVMATGDDVGRIQLTDVHPLDGGQFIAYSSCGFVDAVPPHNQSTIRLYDVEAGTCSQTFQGLRNSSRIASPWPGDSGSPWMFAVGCQDAVQVFDRRTGALAALVPGPTQTWGGTVSAFHGTSLLVGGERAGPVLWDMRALPGMQLQPRGCPRISTVATARPPLLRFHGSSAQNSIAINDQFVLWCGAGSTKIWAFGHSTTSSETGHLLPSAYIHNQSRCLTNWKSMVYSRDITVLSF
jgi:hypothetical protein